MPLLQYSDEDEPREGRDPLIGIQKNVRQLREQVRLNLPPLGQLDFSPSEAFYPDNDDDDD